MLLSLGLLVGLIQGCDKEKTQVNKGCDIQKVHENNASKVTITNGIWGTVALMEGNCMPVIEPATTTCKTCPVKRIIRIYEYTTFSQATPQNGLGFYDSFTTQVIKELDTDSDGFFQTELPQGTYSIVILENGKLHATYFDGQGGLNPVTFNGGKQNVNLTMRYKAVF